MKQLLESELTWAAFVKSVRSTVRLKHSLRADRELNQLLPQLEKAFQAAQKLGLEKDLVVEESARLTRELGSAE